MQLSLWEGLERERWGDRPSLPKPETLGRLLSTCYQARLKREEERPVTFLLVLAVFPLATGEKEEEGCVRGHRVVLTLVMGTSGRKRITNLQRFSNKGLTARGQGAKRV